MALLLHDFLRPEGEFAIWEIEEDTINLFERLELTDEELQKASSMSNARKKEWIAARWLIHKLSGRAQRGRCLKDEYGKPYLEDSKYKISISHSQDKVAVIASPYNVGIDIQKLVEKMRRLSVKFLGVEEASWDNSLEDLHIIWGAKEAMYKAWGKRGIDFGKDMKVEPFYWNNDIIYTTGTLTHKNVTMKFKIKGIKKSNFVLVYAVENQRVIS